ncbi:hypothetical protein Q2941_21335 [Bradyrhizobium sp. UFLA05-153]
MAASLKSLDCIRGGTQQRKTYPRHKRKISVLLINILLGKDCLVRHRADGCNFFRESSIFFREKVWRERGDRNRANAKDAAKHE